VLDGGLGTDTASFANATGSVTVNLLPGGTNGGEAAGDTLTSIENLTGSAFNDTLTGDSGRNILAGGTGNDVLQGGDGADQYLFNKGDGTDTINAVHSDAIGGSVLLGSNVAAD